MNSRCKRLSCLLVMAIAISSLLSGSAAATVTHSPYWFDGFDSTVGNTFNTNNEIATRQGGPLAGIAYVSNSPDVNNSYHHQMFSSPGPLQLAGDINTNGPVLISPNQNFVGTSGSEIIGKKVHVSMDAFTNSSGPTGSEFAWAAITVGGSSPLQAQGAATSDGLSVVFVEDTFSGNGNFIQVWNGANVLGNLIANPAGGGTGFVEIFIDDPIDSNPWDGVGSTDFAISVNSTPIGSFSIGGGGLMSNYITLEGSHQTAGFTLGTHVFDDMLVSTGTVMVIPEPSSLALLAFAGSVAVVRRRRRS